MPGAIDSLITDRVAEDVTAAQALAAKAIASGFGSLTPEEKATYLAGPRGAYGYTDQNRVGSAIAEIKAALQALGRTAAVTPKTDWTPADTEDAAALGAYLAALAAIRTAAGSSAPLPATMAGLTFQGANQIEAMLRDAYEAVRRSANSSLLCGIGRAGVTYVQQGGVQA